MPPPLSMFWPNLSGFVVAQIQGLMDSVEHNNASSNGPMRLVDYQGPIFQIIENEATFRVTLESHGITVQFSFMVQ